jgi:predicted phosphodiesterase
MPVLERVGGLILLNPGSPAYPKFEQDGRPVGSAGLITDTSVQIVSVEDGKTISDFRFQVSD